MRNNFIFQNNCEIEYLRCLRINIEETNKFKDTNYSIYLLLFTDKEEKNPLKNIILIKQKLWDIKVFLII